MFGLGVPELLIILAIVVLLFGGARFVDLGSSLGRGIKEFKRGINDDEQQPPAGKS
ncbi:MAG TPA: twin-arginine translocase TatA/TatE family subunit [Herpetosiphonaceae bacterium]